VFLINIIVPNVKYNDEDLNSASVHAGLRVEYIGGSRPRVYRDRHRHGDRSVGSIGVRV
jgi:hypothetical protein